MPSKESLDYVNNAMQQAREKFEAEESKESMIRAQIDEKVQDYLKSESLYDNSREKASNKSEQSSRQVKGDNSIKAPKKIQKQTLLNRMTKGLSNFPYFIKDYFTKEVPGFFKNSQGKTTFGTAVEGTIKLGASLLKIAAKTATVVLGSIPGPIGTAAGVINGLRIGYNASAEKGEDGKTKHSFLKTAAMMISSAVVGGLAGSIGAAGAIAAVYEGKQLLEESNKHYNKTARLEQSKQASLDRQNSQLEQNGKERSKEKEKGQNIGVSVLGNLHPNPSPSISINQDQNRSI